MSTRTYVLIDCETNYRENTVGIILAPLFSFPKVPKLTVHI